MPQALKTLCLIHFWGWMNSLFPLLTLWGNKNWPPSIKMKKLENFQNKKILEGSLWSSWDALGTQSPLSHPILKLGDFPFLIFFLFTVLFLRGEVPRTLRRHVLSCDCRTVVLICSHQRQRLDASRDFWQHLRIPSLRTFV